MDPKKIMLLVENKQAVEFKANRIFFSRMKDIVVNYLGHDYICCMRLRLGGSLNNMEQPSASASKRMGPHRPNTGKKIP